MVALGSFLPWVETALGAKSGVAGGGPGVWTFYAAVVGLAAIIVPWRAAALAQGAVMALVALVLPVWQLVHALRLVGTGGWMPGAGLVLVLGGGVLAAAAVRRMAVSWPTPAP